MSESDKIMMLKQRQTPIYQRSSVMRNSLQTNCPMLIEKNEWPQTLQIWILWTITSGVHAWIKKYYKFQPKPKTTDKLEVALQTIWEELPQEHINKAVANFVKLLAAYVAVAASGGHFKHLQ